MCVQIGGEDLSGFMTQCHPANLAGSRLPYKEASHACGLAPCILFGGALFVIVCQLSSYMYTNYNGVPTQTRQWYYCLPSCRFA